MKELYWTNCTIEKKATTQDTSVMGGRCKDISRIALRVRGVGGIFYPTVKLALSRRGNKSKRNPMLNHYQDSCSSIDSADFTVR